MSVKLLPLTRSDVPHVVRGWNASLPYAPIAEQTFVKTVFDDPNYEREGHLVALQDTAIVGFAAALEHILKLGEG